MANIVILFQNGKFSTKMRAGNNISITLATNSANMTLQK